jgi:hypothetical protein
MGIPSQPSRGHWEGDTLTLLGKNEQGSLHGRYTWRFDGDRVLHFKLENSQDGGKSWGTFMEGRYEKTA